MGFGNYKYDLTVKDARTGEPITSGCLVFVYTAGTKTLATLYSNDLNTSKTNPISRTQFAVDDMITFYCGASSVDITVNDDKGNLAVIPGITPTEHVVLIDRSGTDKVFIAPYAFDASGAEVDTGLDFPYNVKIYDAMIEVVTVDATETLAIGLLSTETEGDADGIFKAFTVDTAGFYHLWGTTDTTTEDYVSSTYKGALMGVGSAGTSSANDFGQPGGPGHVVKVDKAVSLTYTISSSDTAAGYIYVYFKHLR